MRGTVTKKGKKWYIVVDIGRDENGKRKQKWFSGYRTKKEAEKHLPEILQKVNDGTIIINDSFTVEEYLRKWLKDYAEHNVAPKTYRSYKDTIEIHLIPKLGKYKLSKLTPSIIQGYYTWCINETNLSNTSILYNHKVLRQALKHAVKWRLLSINPCDATQPPKKNKHTVEVLNEEQIKELLNECRDKQIYLPVVLALTTGMRRGEIAGLQWSDVDFEKKMIYVRHALQRINGALKLVPTKTNNSNRPIALPESIIPILRQYRKRQIENKLLIGPEYNDSNFVCAWDDGRPCSPDYITNEFTKIRNKLNLPKVRFHDLRHTHATLLLKEGVHPKIVSERLGHSQIGITLDIYSHVIPEMQKEAAEKIDNKVFSALEEC